MKNYMTIAIDAEKNIWKNTIFIHDKNPQQTRNRELP